MTQVCENKSLAGLKVHSVPHPFSVERIDHTLPLGYSIAEIIEAVQPDPILRSHVHAYINGDYITQDQWARVRPKQDTIVSLRMVPQGGGGKNPLRTVLSVALLAAAPQLSAVIGSSLGAQFGGVFSLSLTQRLITGGVNFLGRLALNAIAPPSRPRVNTPTRETATRFLQGSRNRIDPFGQVPQVLGTHRMVPPLAVNTYTETLGDDQFLRMLFVWGYGPLEIADLKIGETRLEDFEDVEIETRFGYEDDAPITLFSNVVLQNDLQVGLTREQGYELRTTEDDVDEISVDVTCPRGLVEFLNNGNRGTTSVRVEVQYAPTGTEDWSAGSEEPLSVPLQSLDMPETPGIRIRNDGTESPYHRIDSVVVNRFTGQARVILGAPVFGFNGEQVNALSQDLAVTPPLVPDYEWEIARVLSIGNSFAVDLKDCRESSGAIDVAFGSSADFEATVNDDVLNIAAGEILFTGFFIRGQQTTALRQSIRIQVPRGQYDVRLRRITRDAEDTDIFNETFWTALRSIRYENPISETGLALTALRIKATDQLNGTIDQFNGVVTSLVPDFDGQNWIVRASSNPASLFRHVLQGAANARPLGDDRVDLNRIQSWHQNCVQNDREFNAVIGGGDSVMDVLRDIAAAGRASPTIIDGLWGVVEDKRQTVPVQHFTPRNSFNFESERAFEDYPHALRVRFNNREKGWQLDERLVFDNGFDEDNAEIFEQLDLIGVTNPDHIWRDGRYHIASARLRPELYSFDTDIEHIICTRGDLILLTHDVALIGLESARLSDVLRDENNEIIGVRLDAEITMEAAKLYSLRLRNARGETILKNVITAVETTQNIYFETVDNIDIAKGDLAMFGERGREIIPLIVRSIEPQNDLSARMTCVDAAFDLHDIDTGEIPTYQSLITVPPELIPPVAPQVETIQSDASVAQVSVDGTVSPRILLRLNPVANLENLELLIQVRSKDTGEIVQTRVTQVDQTTYVISDVETGALYDISLRFVRDNNTRSAVTKISNYEVEGLRDPPADVEGFSLSIVGDTAYLFWNAVSDIDLSHYQIKHTTETVNPSWNLGVDVVTQVSRSSTSQNVPAMDGVYMIKAVDYGGRVSVNAAFVHSNIRSVISYNQIGVYQQDPLFAGDYTGVFVDNGQALSLAGGEPIDEIPVFDNVQNIDTGETGYALSGTCVFDDVLDLDAVYNVRLTPILTVQGFDRTNLFDQYENVDLIESLDGSAEPDQWGVDINIQTTEDDPKSSDAVWSDWRPFITGLHQGRGFRFSVDLSSQTRGVTPRISTFKICADVPDRLETGQDLQSSLLPETILFDQAFYQRPVVSVTGHDLKTGDYAEISEITDAGFSILFLDKNEMPVVRRFDYIVKGYGAKTELI